MALKQETRREGNHDRASQSVVGQTDNREDTLPALAVQQRGTLAIVRRGLVQALVATPSEARAFLLSEGAA